MKRGKQVPLASSRHFSHHGNAVSYVTSLGTNRAKGKGKNKTFSYGVLSLVKCIILLLTDMNIDIIYCIDTHYCSNFWGHLPLTLVSVQLDESSILFFVCVFYALRLKKEIFFANRYFFCMESLNMYIENKMLHNGFTINVYCTNKGNKKTKYLWETVRTWEKQSAVTGKRNWKVSTQDLGCLIRNRFLWCHIHIIVCNNLVCIIYSIFCVALAKLFLKLLNGNRRLL